MRVFSLFSGIGGFDLAARNLGHEIAGACEIDPNARRVYSRHFPGVPIWEDATKLDPGEIPPFDLLTGGFPCQSFSIAGYRRGFDDTRGTLFFEVARIAQERRPHRIVLENVPGLLSHDEGRTAGKIAAVLDEMGYDTEWRVLDSADFLPQSRKRIFIVGHLGGKCGCEVFPDGWPDRIASKNVHKKPEKGKRLLSENNKTTTITAGYHKTLTTGTYVKTGRIDPINDKKSFYGDGGRCSWRTRIYSKNGISPALTSESSPYVSEITVSDKSTILDDLQGNVRRLTPVECERLQGFPDGWTEPLSNSARYHAIGNAVTVPVVEYILKTIG